MCAYVSFGVWVWFLSPHAVTQLLVTCGDTTICFLIVMSKIALTVLYLVFYSSEAYHIKF